MIRPSLLLLTCALASGAAEIRQYATRVDVAPDGTASAVATVSVAEAAGAPFNLPVGFRMSALRTLDGPQGLGLEAQHGGVKVTLPPGSAACTFSFAFTAEGVFKAERPKAGAKPTIPADSRLVQHAFVNTEAAVIRDYAVEVRLPQGYRFQTIKEALPKAGRTEIEPRVRLGRTEGRETALLRINDADQGDSASMLLEAVPRRRSFLWLVFGAAISALYLFLFRDMTSSKA